MINVNELRIGNLLNWMGRICPVVSIEENGFTVADPSQVKLCSNYHYAPDEVIVEWELTEEWLIKFGFKKKYGVQCWELEGVEIAYETLPKFYRLYPRTNPINSVHQLQNIFFSLTGQELQFL